MANLPKPLIFVVDDDPVYSKLIKYTLRFGNFKKVRSFSSCEKCLENLQQKPGIVFLSYEMDSDANRLRILRKIKQFDPEIYVILISAEKRHDIVIEALKAGASGYIIKGPDTLMKIRSLAREIASTAIPESIN